MVVNVLVKEIIMSDEKTFTIPVKFVFEGKFFIKAESQKEAERIVKEDCAMTLGSGVHSTLNDGDVDWDFPVHADKIVGGEDE
jgi:hypothetical protein